MQIAQKCRLVLGGVVIALAHCGVGAAQILTPPTSLPSRTAAPIPSQATTITSLDPAAPGAVGRSRAAGLLEIRLTVQPGCTFNLTPPAMYAVHCMGDLPYIATLSSNADPDSVQIAHIVASGPAPAAPITATRLELDY